MVRGWQKEKKGTKKDMETKIQKVVSPLLSRKKKAYSLRGPSSRLSLAWPRGLV